MSDMNTIIMSFAVAIAIVTFRIYKKGIEGDEFQRILFIGTVTSVIKLII